MSPGFERLARESGVWSRESGVIHLKIQELYSYVQPMLAIDAMW